MASDSAIPRGPHFTDGTSLLTSKQVLRKVLNARHPRESVVCTETFCRTSPSLKPGSSRPIGCGSCGSVYHFIGTNKAMKKAVRNFSLSDDCSLLNDYAMHQRVYKAFKAAQPSNTTESQNCYPAVQVPRCYDFIPKSDGNRAQEIAKRFPSGDKNHGDVLITEYIPPMSQTVRHALIDHFCQEPLYENAITQDANFDCLIRLYLGKRKSQMPRSKVTQSSFGLRNFPLYVDQMQDLGIDTKRLAVTMAEALAMLHWAVKTDAADVEFVLGGKAHEADRTHIASGLQESSDSQMWLLDFNQCQDMTMDEAGVHQAAKRFFDNDPYYPRPYTGMNGESAEEAQHTKLADEDWEAFRKQYLQTSGHLRREEDPLFLPVMFLAKVREMALQRRQKLDAADEPSSTLASEQGNAENVVYTGRSSIAQRKCPFDCLYAAQMSPVHTWHENRSPGFNSSAIDSTVP